MRPAVALAMALPAECTQAMQSPHWHPHSPEFVERTICAALFLMLYPVDGTMLAKTQTVTVL